MCGRRPDPERTDWSRTSALQAGNPGSNPGDRTGLHTADGPRYGSSHVLSGHRLTSVGLGRTSAMYGLVSKIVAVPNRRHDLISVLEASSANMPGCVSYVIAEDLADENAVWVTEVWDTEAAQKASLAMPAVKDGIGKARTIISTFSRVATTAPVTNSVTPSNKP